jgi:hypothetical protein
MNAQQFLILGAFLLASSVSGLAVAQETQGNTFRSQTSKSIPPNWKAIRLRSRSRSKLLFASSQAFWSIRRV